MNLASVVDRLPRWRSPNGHNGTAPRSAVAPTLDQPAIGATPASDDGIQVSTPFNSLEPTNIALDDTVTVEAPSDVEAGGLHAITRATNYWFNMNVALLEKSARQYAHDWAAKGLPHHDAPRTTPLPIEDVLARRASELFREWCDRVRVKVRDAIELGSQSAAAEVGKLRATIARIEAAHTDVLEANRELRELERASVEDRTPVRYSSLMHGKFWFWAGAISLAAVEFFANFPVFRLLLPMNTALAEVARQAVENAEGSDWGAGPMLLLKDVLLHPEAALVAMVAVIVIVGLSKIAGGAARPLVALRESDYPLAASTIRTARREAWLSLGVASVGLVFALGFLFLSRGQIASGARDRVTQDSTDVQRLDARMTTIGDSLSTANDVRRQLRDANRSLEQHRDDFKYAQTVQQNNVPILLLNVALVTMAAMLGFLSHADDLTEKRGEHPGLRPLRARMAELNREVALHIASARDLAGSAETHVARVRYLLRTQPLHDWRAKQERLAAVISIWRAENARERGLDPSTILAFQEPHAIEFPSADDAEPVAPEDFPHIAHELGDLEAELARVAPRATPIIPMPAIRPATEVM